MNIMYKSGLNFRIFDCVACIFVGMAITLIFLWSFAKPIEKGESTTDENILLDLSRCRYQNARDGEDIRELLVSFTNEEDNCQIKINEQKFSADVCNAEKKRIKDEQCSKEERAKFVVSKCEELCNRKQ